MSRAQIRRSEDDVRPLPERQRGKPASKSDRLSLSQFGERDIDIANVDVNHRFAGFERGIARDIACRFAVPNKEKRIRPDLIWFHAGNEVKERTAGVNLVTFPVMKSTPDQHDPDWPSYPETVLNFATSPPVEIDLRAIPQKSALAQLKEAGFGEPFAIVTAFDPSGRDLPAPENEQRKRALERRLAASGHRFVEVECCSPDRLHCEASVAVIMPQRDAVDLAKELEQVAMFWFDGKRFWIVGGIVETEPLMLPRSS